MAPRGRQKLPPTKITHRNSPPKIPPGFGVRRLAAAFHWAPARRHRLLSPTRELFVTTHACSAIIPRLIRTASPNRREWTARSSLSVKIRTRTPRIKIRDGLGLSATLLVRPARKNTTHELCTRVANQKLSALGVPLW